MGSTRLETLSQDRSFVLYVCSFHTVWARQERKRSPQHQLKGITWLERHLLGRRSTDQQVAIRLHRDPVTRTAPIPTTLSRLPVQRNACKISQTSGSYTLLVKLFLGAI